MENFLLSEPMVYIFASYAFVITAFFIGYRTLDRLFDEMENNVWIAAVENAFVLAGLITIMIISPINLLSFTSMLAFLVCGVTLGWTMLIIITSSITFNRNVKIRSAKKAYAVLKKLHPNAELCECSLRTLSGNYFCHLEKIHPKTSAYESNFRVFEKNYFWRLQYRLSDNFEILYLNLSGEQITIEGSTIHAAGATFVVGESSIGRKVKAVSSIAPIGEPFAEKLYRSSGM